MAKEAASIEQRELIGWLSLTGIGLGVTYLAVRAGAKLGTAGAPFLGHYELTISPPILLAPAVALAVLLATHLLLPRLPWWQVITFGYLAALSWACSLALTAGTPGLTRALANVDNPTGAGSPPGPAELVGWLRHLGLSDVTIGTLLTALSTLTVPLVLIAILGSCGEAAARAYTPVLTLAPYAIWVAGGTDGIVALLGAAGVVLGERASKHVQTGPRAAALAGAAGITLGIAALFSYAVAWLGLSLICLYFARRRPLLHLASGLGALTPVLVASLAGFSWFDGLLTARHTFAHHIDPHRSALWWSGISLVALLLAVGPALIPAVRKIRNTPGWPFVVGAAAAVLFSILAGFARGGVEHAWVPFFPWLLVATTAPEEPGGKPVRPPLLLTAAGAMTAIVTEAVLVPAW